MRLPAMVATATMVLGLGVAPSYAERRVALVIGNGGCKKVATLPNPARDAAAMGEFFRRAGFEAVEVKMISTRSRCAEP
jgi:hypothetical protein